MLPAQDFETFERHYRDGQSQCLALRLVSDLETPVSAYLKLKSLAGEQPSFLLESVEGGATKGRHSIIGLLPDLIWRCRNGASEISRNGSEFAAMPGKPLEALRAVLAESRIPGLSTCRPWRAACSASWAMTWCARWSASRPRSRQYRRARRLDDPPHRCPHLRQCERRDRGGDAGIPQGGNGSKSGARGRPRPARFRGRRARCPADARERPGGSRRADARGTLQHHAGRIPRDGGHVRRNTFWPAISSRLS